VPKSFKAHELVGVVRKRLLLDPKESLFLLVNGKSIVQSSASVESLYRKHRKDDGFLYVQYTSELVSG